MLRFVALVLLAATLDGCVADAAPRPDLLGRLPALHVTLWSARF